MKKKLRRAVIDIGTNSVRLFIAEVDGTKVRPLLRKTSITRLGEGLALTGEISEGPASRTLAVLKRYKRDLLAASPAITEIIATEAVRKASNGSEFAAMVTELLGAAPKVIAGKREAELMAFGALHGYNHINKKVRVPHRTNIVVDVGGGSTEVSVVGAGASTAARAGSGSGTGASSTSKAETSNFKYFKSQLEFCRSFDVGSTIITDRFGLDAPVGRENLGEARQYLQKKFAAVGRAVTTKRDKGMFAVAGTATSLAAMLQELEPYDSRKVHGYEVTAEDVAYLAGMFADLSVRQRRRVIGLEKERAQIILGGILIIEALMDSVGSKSLTVSELDILDALILANEH